MMLLEDKSSKGRIVLAWKLYEVIWCKSALRLMGGSSALSMIL